MKRILHLLTSSELGGAENVAISIINGLRNKYVFEYVSQKGQINDELNSRNIPHAYFNIKNVFSLVKVVSEFKPDIIHAHDFKASILANILFRRIPVISHIHQSPDWQTVTNVKSLAFKYIGSKSNAIIYVSDWARGSFIYNDYLHDVHVVSNGIDFDDIRKKSRVFETNGFDLLFVGRLEEVKDPLRFIELGKRIIKRVPEMRIGIIGDGRMLDLVKDEVEGIKQFDVLGFKNNPYPFISNSKVVLSTSRSDAFGLTMVEASYLGAIPISPNIGGIAQTTKNVNGLVYNGDSEAINYLENLILDTEYYQKQRDMLKLANFDIYDQKRFISDIGNIYSEVVQ